MIDTGKTAAGKALLKDWLRFYYEAEDPPAYRFRYALLAFDITTVVFIVISSFVERNLTLEVLDVLFGLFILADFSARLYISRTRRRDLRHPATWADVVAILSFLIPVAGEGAAFLRVLRPVRLLQTYQILARLRVDSSWFRRNEGLTITLPTRPHGTARARSFPPSFVIPRSAVIAIEPLQQFLHAKHGGLRE